MTLVPHKYGIRTFQSPAKSRKVEMVLEKFSWLYVTLLRLVLKASFFASFISRGYILLSKLSPALFVLSVPLCTLLRASHRSELTHVVQVQASIVRGVQSALPMALQSLRLTGNEKLRSRYFGPNKSRSIGWYARRWNRFEATSGSQDLQYTWDCGQASIRCFHDNLIPFSTSQWYTGPRPKFTI